MTIQIRTTDREKVSIPIEYDSDMVVCDRYAYDIDGEQVIEII